MRVLIAVADVGQGVQLEEALQQANFTAKWSDAHADGPIASAGPSVSPVLSAPEVVVLDADRLGDRLGAVADAWRDHDAVPGVVAIGSSAEAREHAPHARVTLLAPTASIATVGAALREAVKLRLASGMRWPVLRAALKLQPSPNEPAAWGVTILHARNVELEIARSALRWHAGSYATPTERFAHLREERVLSVPEQETSARIDGTLTVQTLVKAGPLDAQATVRLLWALVSMGAVDLTPEVRDVATPARRGLAEIRDHLRARTKRLEHSTYYDVLELTPLAEFHEIERAYRLVSWRYSPQALARYDLAEVAALGQPIWDYVEKARSILVDDAERGRYTDYLRKNLKTMKTMWAIEVPAIKAAAEAFARGQRTLAEGDAHRAMSELAMACRHHPGHPEYEANLAWARFRVEVASGKDQQTTARALREGVEQWLVGRRPWPRALVALALLCAAGNDADAARWHLHIALTIDPNLPAAQQLAHRLGIRR
ncbi:MAG TPA: J domain-containing protein [Kofleriaceae bacterium]|nr:J domain-containing protein [Kofleriaceae bacterium]